MPTPSVHPVERTAASRGREVAGPFLVLPADGVPGAIEAGRRRDPLRWLLQHWHLLSLDAPTIATLWTALIARSGGISLPTSSLVSMFLVVWSLYVSDRLLDARPLRHGDGSDQWRLKQVELEARHRFHHRYRKHFLIALACVTGLLGALLPTLPIAALRLDLLLGALLAGYFVMIHAIEGVRLPKELAVGLFFAAAVFIPTIARRPELRLQLAPVAMLFAGVCSLNCVAIYRWEHPERQHGGRAGGGTGLSRPHAMTLWATHHLRPIGYCLLLGTVGAAAARSAGRADCLAIGAAAAALLWLDCRHRRFAPVTLRALADLALATPLLLLPMSSHLLRR